MKDIRRQVERQSGIEHREPRVSPSASSDVAARRPSHALGCPAVVEASRLTPPQPRSVARASVRQLVADYVTLTKPRVQLLLLLTTVATMEVAGSPSLGLIAADAARRRAVRRRRRRGQPLVRPRHRRADGAHRHAADPGGPHLAARRADVRDRAGRAVVRRAEPDGQRRSPRCSRCRASSATCSSTRCGSSARRRRTS